MKLIKERIAFVEKLSFVQLIIFLFVAVFLLTLVVNFSSDLYTTLFR
ncbi:hypothetical protein [Dolosigranulum pigrum]|nr:hypothetical protein [Dolosigranulum pigrum]